VKHTTETVWEIFCCKLQPFIRKWITNPEIAKDIEQDVFLKIHEKIDTLKDNTKVRSWVLQITRNTVMDYFRKNRVKFQDSEFIFEEIDSPVTIVVKNERNLKEEITSGLRSLIESLPAKYAEALILVEYEGMSQIDLSKKLRISPSAVKSRVQRARSMVKDRLIDCCHYEFDKYGNVISAFPETCHYCTPTS
jgi:RNA polymerase sigma-70 factor (ECF subfamily)